MAVIRLGASDNLQDEKEEVNEYHQVCPQIAHWEENWLHGNMTTTPVIRTSSKCYMIEWTKGEIRPNHVLWPRYALDEGWICQALNIYVRAKKLFNQ